MARYEIFEGNMERLEKKLNLISKKCSKYGCEFHYHKVGETFRELKDEQGNIYTAKFIVVEAEGTAKVNDWEFIASVEHTEKGNILNRVGEIEVPERYYSSTPICEHCNSHRYRKYTYIVRNAITGEFKQVGKSCLKDFTNGLSAEAVAHYISCYDALIEGEAPCESGWGDRYIETNLALKFIAETIRKFGYVRTHDSGRSTASRSFDYYLAYYHMASRYVQNDLEKEMTAASFNPEAPEVLDHVSEALKWVSGQEESNNYIHNLKTACSLQYVKLQNFGIISSLFPTFNRELEYQAEKAEQERKKAEEKAKETNSDHIGNVGDRIKVNVHSIKCLTSFETEWGVTRIYKFIDEAGNVFIWKTGTFIENEEINILVGTVKEHSEFKGIKQTVLTRCKLTA
ncbi:MAG: hypothetical protein PHX61_08030 [Alphaproteobacteria bacterium]|nr:hypothetical protein [Alphaproteobacteria bacterium]